MILDVTLEGFKQIDSDFSGVYGLFLKEDANLDVFIPKIKELIISSINNNNNNLIYIGESQSVFRRVYANHMKGIGASALRDTIWDIFVKKEELNETKTQIINKWLQENTYFKVYPTKEHRQLEKVLINKYHPILNGGIRQFKNKLMSR